MHQYLTVLVTLNLDNHLLETPDDLLAALLWNLLLEVLVGALTVLTGLVFLVLGDVLLGGLLQVLNALLSTSARVDTCVARLLALTSSEVSCVGRVARTTWVSGLGGIAKGILCVALANREARLDLAPQVVLGKVGSLMPCVVVGWLVKVGKFILGRVDLVRGLLRCIACDITEKYGGVRNCKRR
jgi:hypothetical protein